MTREKGRSRQERQGDLKFKCHLDITWRRRSRDSKFTMDIERITFFWAIVFICISRRITAAEDTNDDGQQESTYLFNSVELSFWIALGLAFAVIMMCLCCIFCCKRNSLIPQQNGPNILERTQRGEGQVNGGMEFSDPPPPYSDALKYALSKDDEGLPEYTETYL